MRAAWRVMAGLLLALLAGGCEDRRSFEQGREGGPDFLDTATPAERQAAVTALGQALTRGTAAWPLQPGDTIEVTYLITGAPMLGTYRLGVGDVIDVVVNQVPQFSRQHTVRPDGRITLPMRGEVMAAGLRPADLGRAVAQRYRDEVVDPQVAVHVTRASDEAERFATMVASSAGARAQTLVIAPDGSIALPLLASMRVAGQTVDEVAARARTAYAQRIAGVQPSVRLTATAGQQVFVFGEVLRPGPQAAAPVRSTLQLIAASGGPNEFAAMDQVRVLYWDAAGQPRLRVANLERVLERLALDEDLPVPPGAVIYVPPTQLARAGRFVDQVIRRLFLFTGTSAGLYVNAGTLTLFGASR